MKRTETTNKRDVTIDGGKKQQQLNKLIDLRFERLLSRLFVHGLKRLKSSKPFFLFLQVSALRMISQHFHEACSSK